MSAPHSEHQHGTAPSHSGPIQSPKQLLLAGLLAFIVPVVAIIGLVMFVSSGDKLATGSANPERDLAQRIQKVGLVEIRDANRPLADGATVYQAQCAACHAEGIAGAPKFGEAGLWGPRLQQGFDALVKSALEGKGSMAPQGGGAFRDIEIARAVAYLANAAGGKFSEPEAPQAQDAASTTAAASPSAPINPAPAAEAAPPAATASTTAMPAAGESSAAPLAAATPTPTANLSAGEALYKQTCAVCHVAGVAGAPKLGDKEAWAPRLAQGMDGMLQIIIQGKGAMPPRGGTTASDSELRAALEYMVQSVR